VLGRMELHAKSPRQKYPCPDKDEMERSLTRRELRTETTAIDANP
jgi:hypothetical protein